MNNVMSNVTKTTKTIIVSGKGYAKVTITFDSNIDDIPSKSIIKLIDKGIQAEIDASPNEIELTDCYTRYKKIQDTTDLRKSTRKDVDLIDENKASIKELIKSPTNKHIKNIIISGVGWNTLHTGEELHRFISQINKGMDGMRVVLSVE